MPDQSIIIRILALIITVPLAGLTGCASQQGATAQAAPAPTASRATVVAPTNSCRQSGRTTMVRGDCPIAWDGYAVRVEGTCDVTPGTSSKGACLRQRIVGPNGGCEVIGVSAEGTSVLAGVYLCRHGTEARFFENGDFYVPSDSSDSGPCSSVAISRDTTSDRAVLCETSRR